ncbi:MAG: hypothetical protein HY735_10760 [Verrucomicrobia bacterium]|nr:hypothetical protein [Verrucomicrobiota bacterium]
MKMNRILTIAGLAGLTFLCAGQAMAQPAGPGNFNFDPAQMQQMIMDNYREQLEIKDDAEWKIIGERIQKVLDARREVGLGGAMGGMGGMARMFGRGGQRGGGGQRAGGFGAFFPAPSPEEDALQKALDAKASNADLKAALGKLIAARKQKQANLEKAQAELRQVLTVRQEVSATLSGLL